jgi:uncharacterized protein
VIMQNQNNCLNDSGSIYMWECAHIKIKTSRATPFLMIGMAVLYLGVSLVYATEKRFAWLGKLGIGENRLETLAAANIEGVFFSLEIAETPQSKAAGLMHRQVLEDNQGMLFLFDRPQEVSFWMKNVKQPLDIIFLLNGEVKAIAPNTPPCAGQECPLYSSGVAVNQVIEIKAGSALSLQLQKGDCIEIVRSPDIHLNHCD